MKIQRYKSRSGVAAIIVGILLMLMFFAVLGAAFGFVITQMEGLPTTTAGGVFQADATTFLESFWVWVLIIMVLVPLIVYGFQQAQRRSPGQDV